MKRTIFPIFAGAALIFGGVACERHPASELEDAHGGAPKSMDTHSPGAAAKTHSSEGIQTNPGGSGPVAVPPKPDKGELQKAGTANPPKFFPDSK